MLTVQTLSRTGGRVAVLVCLAGLVAGDAVAANKGPIRQLTLDPAAEVVPLFDGLKSGQFEARISPQNAYSANVVIANPSDKPLTVALPKAAVGVHVLPQFGQFGQQGSGFGNSGFGSSGFFNGGSNSGQNGLAQGTAQSVGGPFQALSGNGSFNATGTSGTGSNFFGQGFPSVPAEMVSDDLKQYGGLATIPAGKSIQLRLKTVCLNYGRPDPMPSLNYALIPVEQHSQDPVLAELLESYTERVDRDVMQAAAWHVANDLSWDRIATLSQRRIPAGLVKLFTSHQVEQAKSLMGVVETAAKNRPATNPAATVAASSPKNR